MTKKLLIIAGILLIVVALVQAPPAYTQSGCEATLNNCLNDCAAFGYPNGCVGRCIQQYSACDREGFCEWPEYCPI